jgi:hypothetical protein
LGGDIFHRFGDMKKTTASIDAQRQAASFLLPLFREIIDQ